jgi:hypothetical protein
VRLRRWVTGELEEVDVGELKEVVARGSSSARFKRWSREGGRRFREVLAGGRSPG